MDINKLLKKREKKQDYKNELYNKILLQCHRRIEYCSNTGDLYGIFTIPNYVIGYPLFDKKECCDFLTQNLCSNGFKVQSFNNEYIYITWAHIYDAYKENKEKENKLLNYEPNVTILETPIINEKPLDKINSIILNRNNKFSLLK
jgi:hypothetical protein